VLGITSQLGIEELLKQRESDVKDLNGCFGWIIKRFARQEFKSVEQHLTIEACKLRLDACERSIERLKKIESVGLGAMSPAEPHDKILMGIILFLLLVCILLSTVLGIAIAPSLKI
jgi:hypothetical protein